MNRILKIIYVVSACVLTTAIAAAEPPAPGKADRDRDGVVDRKERRMENRVKDQKAKADISAVRRLDADKDGVADSAEKRRSWLGERAKVNTPVEAKYDKDGSGWLEPSEAREMLKDKYTLIETQGKARVDTDIERAYDLNNDGILDIEEAKKMKEDLR